LTLLALELGMIRSRARAPHNSGISAALLRRHMSLLSRLFGGRNGAGVSGGLDDESAVTTLSVLYDDPEVVSERGISISSPRADEVRAVGQQLHKAGGKERMVAARDRFRE